MKADEVARKTLSGIKSGSFFIPCNFEGLLLSIATAGLAPQRSYLMAFVEIVAAGISRFAALCFQWNWYGSIEKWHTQNKSKYFTKCSIKHQEDWYPSPCLIFFDETETTCFKGVKRISMNDWLIWHVFCVCVWRTSVCVHNAWHWQSIENLMQKCPWEQFLDHKFMRIRVIFHFSHDITPLVLTPLPVGEWFKFILLLLQVNVRN